MKENKTSCHTDLTDLRKLRKCLQDKYGKKNVKISNSGEIRVYGTLPNTNKVGWRFFGFVSEINTDLLEYLI